jgi:DNA primase
MGLYNFASNLTTKRFYNSDILNDLQVNEQLLITEGEFDTMIATQCNYNAAGLLGVSNFPVNELNKVKNLDIYLSLDNDLSGKEAVQKIVEYFEKPIKVLKLIKHKDLTELVNG